MGVKGNISGGSNWWTAAPRNLKMSRPYSGLPPITLWTSFKEDQRDKDVKLTIACAKVLNATSIESHAFLHKCSRGFQKRWRGGRSELWFVLSQHSWRRRPVSMADQLSDDWFWCFGWPAVLISPWPALEAEMKQIRHVALQGPWVKGSVQPCGYSRQMNRIPPVANSPG